MKKNLILLIFLFCIKSTFAQTEFSLEMNPKIALNTAGWFMIGTGITMIIGGIAINANSEKYNGQWLTYLGSGIALASIPVFISGGKNKRRVKIALRETPLLSLYPLSLKSSCTTLDFILQF